MPAIRHVAIKCKDPSAMAEFYRDTFDMHVVARLERSVFMSDGYINLALLPAREGEKTGINHFGFLCEDVGLEEIEKRLAMAEVGEIYEKPKDGRYAEWGAKDPEGNRFDIGVAGWYTEPDQGPAPTGTDAR
jgi:catechol 2,3-dioxygenase-like lactoylglutathione lyase family enzyme